MIQQNREHEKNRVLIVEDSIDLSMLWQRLFSAKGYETAVANDARSALRQFVAGHDFDIVVSDYFLPDMNGIGLLERMREIDGEIPFVLVTGSRETSIEEKALSFGSTVFMNKPVKFAILEEQIRNLLERTSARQSAV
jgi:DNA-binding NtrC family response regulator